MADDHAKLNIQYQVIATWRSRPILGHQKPSAVAVQSKAQFLCGTSIKNSGDSIPVNEEIQKHVDVVSRSQEITILPLHLHLKNMIVKLDHFPK